jgi:hypothetical protein
LLKSINTNGERLVNAREEDDEDDEVQGHLQEGRWFEEGHHGGEEVVAWIQENAASQSHIASLKNSVFLTYKDKWVVVYYNS